MLTLLFRELEIYCVNEFSSHHDFYDEMVELAHIIPSVVENIFFFERYVLENARMLKTMLLQLKQLCISQRLSSTSCQDSHANNPSQLGSLNLTKDGGVTITIRITANCNLLDGSY